VQSILETDLLRLAGEGVTGCRYSLISAKLLGHSQFSPQMTQIKATDKIRGFGPFYLWLLLLFITTLTVEFEADARGAAVRSQNPGAIRQRWIVAQMLSMAASQNRAPVMLVVLIEIYNLLLHRSSRT